VLPLRFENALMTKPSAPTLSPLVTAEPWDLVSEGYGAELWGQFSSYARFALELARIVPGAEVLDVATGPGTLAVQAARTARHVVAVGVALRSHPNAAQRALRCGAAHPRARGAAGYRHEAWEYCVRSQ